MNPICENIILDSGEYELEKVQKSIVPWFEIHVYCHRM